MEHLRRYLLGSSVLFQAPDTPGTPPEEPEKDRVELDPEDDETPADPADEEATEEGEDDKGADEVEATPKPEDRGRRQFGALRATNRTLAEENASLTRKMAELEGRIGGLQQHYAQQPVETPQQREHRLAQLSPEDRLRTEFREELQVRDRQNAQMRHEGNMTSDAAQFAAVCASSPYAKRFAPEVEKAFNEYAAKGLFVQRQLLLRNIIGEKVLSQEGKAKPRAAANRQRQAAKPVNYGSDTRTSRSRHTAGSAADFEARFGDVPI